MRGLVLSRKMHVAYVDEEMKMRSMQEGRRVYMNYLLLRGRWREAEQWLGAGGGMGLLLLFECMMKLLMVVLIK